MKNTFAMLMLVATMCAAVPAFADHTVAHKAATKTDMMFDKADTDHDGKISKAEHDAAGTEMFNEADTNKDGSLTKDEMKAHKKMKMQETRAKMNEKK